MFTTMPAEKLDHHSVTGSADWYPTSFHITLNGGQTSEKRQNRLKNKKTCCNQGELPLYWLPYPDAVSSLQMNNQHHDWHTFMTSLHLMVSLPCSDSDARLYCWKKSGEKRKQAYAEWAEFTDLSASFKRKSQRHSVQCAVLTCREEGDTCI